MNTWIRRTLQVGLVSAGFVLVGAAAAHAATSNDGLLNGTGAIIPVQLPVNVCGNAVGLAGDATAGCEDGATALLPGGGGGGGSASNSGVGNGSLVVVPVQAPVNVGGNAVGALGGTAQAASTGGATARTAPSGSGGGGAATNSGIGNGTLLVVPVQAPINVCGNAVGAVGDAEAACETGATARAYPGSGGSGGAMNDGVANGSTLVVPVQLPVNVCGNAVGAVGDAAAGCEAGALAKFGPHTPTAAELARTSQTLKSARMAGAASNSGILNGTHVLVPVQAPVNVCGNAVGAAGDAEAACQNGATARNMAGSGSGSGSAAAHNHGLLNGTFLGIPVQAPINVAGNAVGALGGQAAAYSTAGAIARLL